jgi:hypothetical protein
MAAHHRIKQIGTYTAGEISYLVGLDEEGNLFKLVKEAEWEHAWVLITPNDKDRYVRGRDPADKNSITSTDLKTLDRPDWDVVKTPPREGGFDQEAQDKISNQ